MVVQSAFRAGADAASIRAMALTLLFATTCFWVAYNRWTGVDRRGLGWFSFFFAVTLVPAILRASGSALTGAEIWLATNWLIWAVLWFMYFPLLALGRPVLKQTVLMTVFAGIVTGWLPDWLLLDRLV